MVSRAGNTARGESVAAADVHKRIDVQGLRAVAVAAVVLYHAGLPVPGGFTGVDMFFVVSGFVITAMLLRELERAHRLRFADFYRRRVRRLLPALGVLLVAVGALSFLLQSPIGEPSPQATTARTGVAASAFLGNVEIYRTVGGYFDAPAEANPLLHTWTLAVEEQFYLVFPMFIALAWAIGRRRGRARGTLIVALSGALLASFALGVAMTADLDLPVVSSLLGNGSKTFAFYGSPTRAWEFAAGALLAAVPLAFVARRGSLMALSGVGVLLVLASCFALGSTTPLPGVAALAPVVGTAALIAVGSVGGGPVTRALEWPVLTWIGDRSYGIYLWHWPLIVFAKMLWPESTIATVAAGLIAVAPAAVSYRYVEEPIRRGRVRMPALAVAAACVVVPAVAFVGLNVTSTRRAAAYEVGPPTCDPADWARIPIGSTVWLVGDSHAGVLEPALQCASVLDHLTIVDRHMGGCPFSFVSVASPPEDLAEGLPTTEECAHHMEDVVRQMRGGGADVVVIGNRSPRYVEPPSQGFANRVAIAPWGRRADVSHIASVDENLETWKAGLSRAVGEARGAGAAVVIWSTVPEQDRWAGDCAAIFTLFDCRDISADAARARLVRVAAVEGAIAQGARGVSSVDVFDFFCSTVCTQHLDGRLAYRDNDHLNELGILAVGDQLVAGIDDALNELDAVEP